MSQIAVELVRLFLKHHKDLDRVNPIVCHLPGRKDRVDLVLLKRLPQEIQGLMVEYIGAKSLYLSTAGVGFPVANWRQSLNWTCGFNRLDSNDL